MTRTRPPQPQVSVIVPVYNQEQYLEECISSIRRQTLAEWECIIVNDGSSDSSGEIARRFSEEDLRHISAPGVPLEKQSGIPGRHSPL